MRPLNKAIILFVAISLISACSQQLPISPSLNTTSTIKTNVDYATVKFKINLPDKYYTEQEKTAFGIKAIKSEKINKVRIIVKSLTKKDFSIERDVNIIPGGIEASVNMPLDKLYVVTVQGLNNANKVYGAEIKGYFPLKSTDDSINLIAINQQTTPVAKILELLAEKFPEKEEIIPVETPIAKPSASAGTTTTSGTGLDLDLGAGLDLDLDAGVTTTTPTTTTTATATTTTSTDLNKLKDPSEITQISDINLEQLRDLVERMRRGQSPSLVNVDAFVNEIVTKKKVPDAIPIEKSLFKYGRIKGVISGLKANEIVVINVEDPSSQSIIVSTSPKIYKLDDEAEPDETVDDIDFIIDNVIPGKWKITAIASGYNIDTEDTKDVIVEIPQNLEEVQEVTEDFTFVASKWGIKTNNLSGNVGSSDQAASYTDFDDNIHVVWRQDGFDTDSNSGIIFYSRWNKTSWSTQNVNVSQYDNSNLSGSRDPSVAVGLDRNPHIVWSAKKDGVRKIFYNYFDGITWHKPDEIPGSSGGFGASVAVDSKSGFVYAVWESGESIYFTQYNRTKWGTPMVVASGGVSPKIVMGSDGVAHIIWKAASSQTLKYINWNIDKGLGKIENIPLGALGNDVNSGISVAIDRFNRVHLIWRNDIYVQYILRSYNSWSIPEVVNQISNTLMEAVSSAGIFVSSTGVVNVAWGTKTKNDKEVVRFRRRLSDGWKMPFEKITDPLEEEKDETTTTTTTTTTEDVVHTENLDGYEDIPLSYIGKIDNVPIISTDELGNIHVIWVKKGGDNDSDLIHAIKTKASEGSTN